MYLYCNSMYATHEHEMIKHLPHIKALKTEQTQISQLLWRSYISGHDQ